jgi:hypothetical protein
MGSFETGLEFIVLTETEVQPKKMRKKYMITFMGISTTITTKCTKSTFEIKQWI